MNLLIQNTTWINPGDENSEKWVDIRIRDGKLVEFNHELEPAENEEVLDADHYFCSPGWLDLKTTAPHPAFHQNESPETLSKAAAAGGYTKILLHPTEKTPLQLPESVHFFKNYRNENGVKFLVAASPSIDLEGKKMTDMLTLVSFGADAFSAPKPISDASFFSQLLLYLQHADKVLIHNPQDPNLSAFGQIHEGIVSERRGLAGIPSVGEETMLYRDIALSQYTGGKIHFSSLSTADSRHPIITGKFKKVKATTDVCAHQLAFNEEFLDSYNTIHKVLPPYRGEKDRLALIDELLNQGIDSVVSGHTPLHNDFKDIEFENAGFGISSLETTFSTLRTFAGDRLKVEWLVELLSTNPKKILGMEQKVLSKGMEVDFTIFSIDKRWIPNLDNWQSKSKNNPFFGTELTGLVFGVVTSTGFHPNPHVASEVK